jgi:hypothetical protein
MQKALNAAALLPAALVVMTAVAAANPSPGASWANGGPSLLQTAEFVLQSQRLSSDDSATVVILYGGPSFVYTRAPDKYRGYGLGLEAGIEFRRQISRRSSGPFMSLYAGVGSLWPFSETDTSWIRAVSSGFKMGWRIPVVRDDRGVDVEPYAALAYGFSLTGDWAFSGAVYLGLKFALF